MPPSVTGETITSEAPVETEIDEDFMPSVRLGFRRSFFCLRSRMADNEKSSSPAATAKGTAPSISKNYSSLPPIFQVSDPQAKDEKRWGLAYDEGNQGEAYDPDYLYGGENYHKALSDVVSYVLRGCAGDDLSVLSDDVVKVTNALVAWVNLSEPPSNPEAGKIYGRGFHWPKLKSIDPVQAAELVFAQEVIRMVCVKETVDKPTSEGVLAMYDPDEGIYREIGDGQIDLWLSLIHI